MNENVKALIDTVGTDISGKWISAEKLETFAKDVIVECLKQIEVANSQHCAYTTFDLGIVNCAKEKITDHIKQHFEVKDKSILGVF
jgi:hypothetical protein